VGTVLLILTRGLRVERTGSDARGSDREPAMASLGRMNSRKGTTGRSSR
jgi:hypothetical protein